MKTHFNDGQTYYTACGRQAHLKIDITSLNESVTCKFCLNIIHKEPLEPNFSPSDEVGVYHWGTCGQRVKFCMSVLADFMTDAEKKRISKKIAKWYNRHGFNYVDENGKKI